MTSGGISMLRDSGLDPAVADLLEQLADRVQAGDTIDADQLAREHPEHAEQLLKLLPAVQALAALDTSKQTGSYPPVDGDLANGVLGDFQIIREVGRGGMGIVYEAEQISLNRRVALKVLPLAATMDPRHLQRFRNEAQAAACLHHPNIVPVHGVGCDRGVHYYAMQLIDGQTLAQVIAGRAGGVNPPVAKSVVEENRGVDTPRSPAMQTKRDKHHFRHIAELIAQTADALEYAHSMGVLHRDIKPANLMLDNAGGLWITDFGLAKLASPGGHAGGVDLTLTGDLIGTLRYMSPEAALARHGLVDHRTDIYSLGATLYELLTLKPAVPGTDKQEILKAIAWEDPTPLRKLDKSIPAELETIALKCLAKNPTDRYPSAKEMADDLRHWMNDKPIVAKPPGWREKVTKWGRRHVAAVWATIGVLSVALVILGVSSWLLWKKERQVHEAYLAESRQQQLARSNLNRALKALEEIHLRIVDQYTAKPKLDAKDKKLLDDILAFYEGFAAENAGETSVALESARAYLRIGKIQLDLGRLAEAEAALRRSVERSRSAADVSPMTVAGLDIYSDALLHLGHTIRLTPLRVPEAAHQYRECARVSGLKPTDGDPEPTMLQCRAAESLSALGTVVSTIGELQEASLAHEQAVTIARNLLNQAPDDRIALRTLGHALSNQAQSLKDSKEFDKSHAASREAIQLLEALFQRDPDPDIRSLLANAHCIQATSLEAQGATAKAEPAWERAAALFPKLIGEYPGFAEHRGKLARTLGRLSTVQTLMGNEKKAEQSTLRAISILDGLVSELPTNLEYRFLLAENVASLGTQKLSSENSAEAEPFLRRSVELIKKLVEEKPENDACVRQWAQFSSYLGTAMVQNKNPDAETHLRTGVAIGRKLATEKPNDREIAGLLLDSLDMLGLSLIIWDRSAEAEVVLRETEAGRRKAVDMSPNNPLENGQLAGSLGALSEAVYCQGRAKEAIPLLEESVARSQTFAQQLSSFSQARGMASNSEAHLAWVLCNAADPQLRNIPRALQLAEKAVKSDPNSGSPHFKLGAALFRSGRSAEAVGEMEKGFRLTKRNQEPGECESAWLVLSMALHQNGERIRPWFYYFAAAQWARRNRPNDVGLQRLSAEAAAMLGIQASASESRGELVPRRQ